MSHGSLDTTNSTWLTRQGADWSMHEALPWDLPAGTRWRHERLRRWYPAEVELSVQVRESTGQIGTGQWRGGWADLDQLAAALRRPRPRVTPSGRGPGLPGALETSDAPGLRGSCEWASGWMLAREQWRASVYQELFPAASQPGIDLPAAAGLPHTEELRGVRFGPVLIISGPVPEDRWALIAAEGPGELYPTQAMRPSLLEHLHRCVPELWHQLEMAGCAASLSGQAPGALTQLRADWAAICATTHATTGAP